MNARENIIAVIKNTERPSLDDLVQNDTKDYSALRYSIQILTGKKTDAKIDLLNHSLKFTDNSNVDLLELKKTPQGKWEGNNELAKNISALLVAVRIQEVDSFEWVYLPPEFRQKLVTEMADFAGTSSLELKRLMNIWTA